MRWARQIELGESDDQGDYCERGDEPAQQCV